MSVALCSLLAATLPGLAAAAEGGQTGNFHAYVEAGIGHDTNVFRVDDDVSPLADVSSDGFWTAEAGFDSRLTHGRQSVGARALAYHIDYSELDDVDFTGGNAELAWNWAVGQLWIGTLGYEYQRDLRDFANQRVPRIDVKTSDILSGSVERQLSNRVRLGTNADFADIEFSESDLLGQRRTRVGASLDFDSPAGNTISLDADFAERESDEPGGVNFTEFLLGPALDWRITDKSSLLATLRYAERDEDDPALEDYSGLTGRVTWRWSYTESRRVVVSLWREVSSLGEEIANFALVTGISIRPTISIRDRVSVHIAAGYEFRDFQGDPDRILPPGQDIPLRDDEVLTGALGIVWTLTERIDLMFDYESQYRESTRFGQDYDFHRIEAGFRVGL